MAQVFSTAQACEDAFYAAFNAGDFEQMTQVWATTAAVWCVHPSGPVLRGHEAVMASWQQILDGTSSAQFSVSDHEVVEHGDLAVRCVHENIHHGPGLRSLSVVLATNVFVREEGAGWKMSSHHASPAPPPPPQSQQRSRGTMH